MMDHMIYGPYHIIWTFSKLGLLSTKLSSFWMETPYFPFIFGTTELEVIYEDFR